MIGGIRNGARAPAQQGERPEGEHNLYDSISIFDDNKIGPRPPIAESPNRQLDRNVVHEKIDARSLLRDGRLMYAGRGPY